MTTRELARAREDAAADLEAMIVRLGETYRHYADLTDSLGARVHADLTQRLQGPILLHLAAAGLTNFLERKFVGPAPDLRTLVEEQHAAPPINEPT